MDIGWGLGAASASPRPPLSTTEKAPPGPSNIVPVGVWYGFMVRTINRATNKVLHWRVRPLAVGGPGAYLLIPEIIWPRV